jgi:hypothetical protein
VPGLDVVDADPEADLARPAAPRAVGGPALRTDRRARPARWNLARRHRLRALFGTERALVKDLHRRVAAFGLSVQIAIADTAGCAHAVARHVPAGRPVTIEPGDHRKAMRCCRSGRCGSRPRSSRAAQARLRADRAVDRRAARPARQAVRTCALPAARPGAGLWSRADRAGLSRPVPHARRGLGRADHDGGGLRARDRRPRRRDLPSS